MSSTNKLITPINSLCFWKRKIPRSNLECLAPSLHSSSRTLRYQYRDASASPYMHLCNFHILSVCASFGGLTRTFCSNSFSCRNAVLTSIEWICHFFCVRWGRTEHGLYTFSWACWAVGTKILLFLKTLGTKSCFGSRFSCQLTCS